MKVLVTPTSFRPGCGLKALETLEGFTKDIVFNPTGKPLTQDELIPLLQDCDGYIAGLDDVTAKVLDACPKLKVVSRYGAGCDRVDLAAAKAKGILVTNTPGVNAEAVGELTFALILAAARKVPALDRAVRNGEWPRASGMELFGKTIGIVGLGAIGKVVARCAAGFRMRVLAYDPYINPEYCAANGVESVTLDALLRDSDVVTLHLPLMDSTRGLIGKDQIAAMKDGVILVNASRGGIIDEAAAYEGLRSGKIGGLGLDAFEQEPPRDSPLFSFPNVVATPHAGAHTAEATRNMADLSVKNLIDVLSGAGCSHIVNR